MATIVRKHGNKFRVRFYNELTGEYSKTKLVETEKEAKDRASKIEIEFYKENKKFLPKGVTIYHNLFRLSIDIFLINKKVKSKLIASTRTLKEIKELKLKCLNSIIG